MRKNPEEYKTVELKIKTTDRLDKLKVHKNQSYNEVVEKLLENKK